jgi:hypothetical protein
MRTLVPFCLDRAELNSANEGAKDLGRHGSGGLDDTDSGIPPDHFTVAEWIPTPPGGPRQDKAKPHGFVVRQFR